MRRLLFLIAILAAAGVAALVLLTPGGSSRPNVLLISLDTARPDHLGCYGYEEISTPVVDGLAGDGILFEDAMTSVPLTLPSHASLFTGLYPPAHGIRDNGAYRLPQELTTLAEVLAAEGYATGAFIGAFVLDSEFGLDQGFSEYDDDMPEPPSGAMEIVERRAGAVTRQAIAWLEEAEEPFFAFVHYYDPHTPYDPPPAFDEKYPGRPYDGEIAYCDEELGRVLETLRRRRALDNTLVVLVSDHGEGLGEHGEEAHGILIYETTMKVALVVRLPEGRDIEGAGPGSRVERPVELVDVFPTVIDLLELDVPEAVDGRSLLPLLRGEDQPVRFCYLESMYPYLAYRWSPLRGVRFNRWKYILAPEPELYDLDRDPGETRNLIEAEPERARELKSNLLVMAARISADRSAESRMDPDEARKLQALGYVSGGGADIPEDLEPAGPDPKHMIEAFQSRMAEGQAALEAGRHPEALGLFRELARTDPGNPKVQMHLARSLVETGRLKEAGEVFEEIARLDSASIESISRMGDYYMLRGDPDRALFFYKLTARLAGSAAAMSNAGNLLMEAGKTGEAHGYFDRALKLDPRDRSAMVNKALAYLSEGRKAEAEKWFRKILEIYPEDLKALMNMASLEIGNRNFEGAAGHLEKAREAAPEDVKVLLNLGNVYRRLGRHEDAASAFEAARTLEPENTMVLFGLAAVRSRQGRRQEAVELLRRILEIDPGFTPAGNALDKVSGG
jgi:arylsulfatase A-like enzyme/Flp pilus assembly protein TadD